MTNSYKEGQPGRLLQQQRKQILMELANGIPLKEIADEYGTNEKMIQRIRQKALKNPGLRSSMDPKVQAYLTNWELEQSKPSIVTSNVVLAVDHVEDLRNCAKKLVKIMETFAGLPKEYTIEDEITIFKDFENLKFFENKTTRGLLVHLAQCEDFPQLKKLDSWNNLSISDINEVFLALISLKAASRDFKGECDICRVKPGSNTKVA